MTALLATQRRQRLLRFLEADGAIRISAVAPALSVSTMTVRRDIDQLATEGLCVKVHGGAARPVTAHEPDFTAKVGQNVQSKSQIARAAAALVLPGQAVGLGSGTTTHLLALELAGRVVPDRLTIVTNSIPAAEVLSTAGAPEQVILTGGTLTPSRALVGPVTEAVLSDLRFDWLFLGVYGITQLDGLTTPNVAEASTSRAFMASASTTVVVADSSKWSLRALAQIAPIGAADRILMDSDLPSSAAKTLGGLTELTLVETK